MSATLTGARMLRAHVVEGATHGATTRESMSGASLGSTGSQLRKAGIGSRQDGLGECRCRWSTLRNACGARCQQRAGRVVRDHHVGLPQPRRPQPAAQRAGDPRRSRRSRDSAGSRTCSRGKRPAWAIAGSRRLEPLEGRVGERAQRGQVGEGEGGVMAERAQARATARSVAARVRDPRPVPRRRSRAPCRTRAPVRARSSDWSPMPGARTR